MIKPVSIYTPTNILDNMYNSTKKTVQDMMTSSYDDIDNVIPDDILDIDFSKKNENKQTTTQQNWLNRSLENIKSFFSSKK